MLRVRGGAIAIAVVDRGIGMDPHEVELAMTRFGQVASAWSRAATPAPGSACRWRSGLTELHGGTLTIHSIKGVGTTVTVAFPPDRSETLPIAALTGVGGLGRRY